jgi:hypothetical protein
MLKTEMQDLQRRIACRLLKANRAGLLPAKGKGLLRNLNAAALRSKVR